MATVATPGVCGSGELSGAASEHCATNRKEGNSDARLVAQSKPPQGQMASRPFSRDEENQNPLWDGSDIIHLNDEGDVLGVLDMD